MLKASYTPSDSRLRQSWLRSRRAPFKHATELLELSVLIKKKDVNDYFAARRARHPLSVKQASAVAATRSSIVKRASKPSSAAPMDAVGSSASTENLNVPFFTSEPGFIGARPLGPVVKEWTKE